MWKTIVEKGDVFPNRISEKKPINKGYFDFSIIPQSSF